VQEGRTRLSVNRGRREVVALVQNLHCNGSMHVRYHLNHSLHFFK
jgi:hypothetical protein